MANISEIEREHQESVERAAEQAEAAGQQIDITRHARVDAPDVLAARAHYHQLGRCDHQRGIGIEAAGDIYGRDCREAWLAGWQESADEDEALAAQGDGFCSHAEPRPVKLEPRERLRNGAIIVDVIHTSDRTFVLASDDGQYITWCVGDDGSTYWGHYFRHDCYLDAGGRMRDARQRARHAARFDLVRRAYPGLNGEGISDT